MSPYSMKENLSIEERQQLFKLLQEEGDEDAEMTLIRNVPKNTVLVHLTFEVPSATANEEEFKKIDIVELLKKSISPN